ncbi:expressed unknown protein [Seminavis robusta]|uniref:HMG box domain-containing protein n=1 Tax=Seminavis robusta TaxID=568900 RepID=A0A9N8DYL6_9STRA|nr:expressed unknown protein [Seminavis robusta]|eukprot:Sro381_g130760.1 n/a (635) ;mRNA; r:12438-14342
MMPSSGRSHQENPSNTSNNHSSNNSESGSISNSNHGMNVNPNANVNYSGSRGSGSGSNSAGGSIRAGVGDQIRQRYHHGHGGDMGSSAGGGGMSASAFGGSMSMGGPMMGGPMAAMGDYSGLNHYGRAAGLGPSGLGHFNPAGASAAGGMNAAMNPSLYPHIGATAGMQSPQQQAAAAAALGDQLDFRQGGPNSSSAAGNPQAEQEEELLLNILIARRQRQFGTGGGGGPGPATSWADDFMRLREKTMNSQQQDNMGAAAASGGDRMQYDGMTNALQQGDGSHRSHSAGRMSIGSAAGAMAHMQNPNMTMNNMGMNMQPPQNRQFLSDASGRLRHRGSMGFPMGSPQGAWMGATNAAAAMHSHPNNPANSNLFAHGGQRQDMMKSNTQLGMDVLESVDRMMPGNMMHDARMAEQGSVSGQNPYHNRFAVGQHHGMSIQDPPGMGLGKRSMEGQQGMEKAGKMTSQHPMQHMFHSPQQQQMAHSSAEEAQPAAKKKRLHKRKPADMPRRPLSAYNLFFSEERERILREIEGKTADDDEGDKDGKDDAKPKALLRPLLPSEKKRRPHRKTHGKISFKLLAQKVGQRWKELSDHERQRYKDMAQEDMKRQKKAMEEYYQKRSVLASSDTTANAKEAE